MSRGRPWSEDELILALDLYCRTPFGKLHRRNPEIIHLANALGRTPDSVGMKCCNFASLDPDERARGITGLRGASAADERVFARFAHDLRALETARREAAAKLAMPAPAEELDEETYTKVQDRLEGAAAVRDTEQQRVQTVRRLQSLFRQVVLVGYEDACAACGIAVVQLLDAAHIIPWSLESCARLDPANGIAMCCLHHRAFDVGLMTIDPEGRIVIARRVRDRAGSTMHRVALTEIHGRPLRMPRRFRPSQDAFAHHRERIFRDG